MPDDALWGALSDYPPAGVHRSTLSNTPSSWYPRCPSTTLRQTCSCMSMPLHLALPRALSLVSPHHALWCIPSLLQAFLLSSFQCPLTNPFPSTGFPTLTFNLERTCVLGLMKGNGFFGRSVSTNLQTCKEYTIIPHFREITLNIFSYNSTFSCQITWNSPQAQNVNRLWKNRIYVNN